ncbi:MAG TPA: response regulator, partial [Fibrobacteria bacterium]|nr:response regulator [Fibrobacteria bacterium]
MPIQVLIVDDSAVMRQVMTEILGKHSDIQVMGAAPDPIFAMERMKVQWPDVVILDVEMPRMDGVSFLQKIMATRPVPVIICSTLAGRGTDVSYNALAAGAFAIVEKPKLGLKDFLKGSASDLVSIVRAASGARMDRMLAQPSTPNSPSPPEARPKLSADEMIPAPSASRTARMTERFVAIGCSTGGTQALELVLTALPRTSPGIVVVQHMPEQFTKGFAQRLNKLCQ